VLLKLCCAVCLFLIASVNAIASYCNGSCCCCCEFKLNVHCLMQFRSARIGSCVNGHASRISKPNIQ
jgi:hypothetical protein